MKKVTITFAVTLLLFASCTYNIPNIDKHSKDTAVADSMQKAASVSKPIPVSNINVEIAEEVAKSFFASASRQKTRNLSILSRDSIMDWKNRTSIYVFNVQPKGYVLTSADIKNEAIIGFSEDGNFSARPQDMPSALIATLAEIIINNRVEIEGQPKAFNAVWDNNKNDWDKYYNLTYNKKYEFEESLSGDPCKDSIGKLIKEEFSNPDGYFCRTNWGQEEPYNYYAPSHEYPIGCVAVAIGQIMKFHRHPWFFNWDIMPYACKNPYDKMTEGEKEVARLLRDIGWMVKMSYAKDGSGATDYMAWWALYYKYHYWADMPAKWDYNKIVAQLRNRKTPVYVSGFAEKYQRGWWIFKWYTYERGHAYIIDGVQEMKQIYEYECGGHPKISIFKTELLHYNFGWGRYYKADEKGYNIWFSRSIVDVSNSIIDKDVITGASFPNYQYEKICIYNISPK